MKKLLLNVPVWFLLLTSIVGAVVFSGAVVAYVSVINALDFDMMKIGETQTKTLAVVNETIEPYNLNVSVVCLGKDSISAKLEFKSNDFPASKPLDLNGTTPIDSKIDSGNITLTVIGTKQGAFDCMLEPIASNYTIIEFVDAI